MTRWILAILVLVCVPVAYAAEPKEYPSPDGRLRALVMPASERGTGTAESRIEIHKRDGTLIFKKEYSSPDGGHGWVVNSVAWTHDSRFFMFGMYSSGGHQPWHSPVYFYSKKHNRTFSLEDYVGTIIDPKFQVSGADSVKVITRGKADIEDVEITVSLSELLKRGGHDSGKSADWRTVLLTECAKLKALIQKKIDFSADGFIAYPDQDATEPQLEENLGNLLMASYDLNIIKPIPGAKAPKRVSEGVSAEEAIKAIGRIEALQKHIDEQLAEIRIRLDRNRDSSLALKEMELKASRKFWENELRHLREFLKGFPQVLGTYK